MNANTCGIDPASLDWRGCRRPGEHTAVGGDRLFLGRGGFHRHRGRPRRRLWPPPHLHGRPRSLHRLLCADRTDRLGGRCDWRPCHPGGGGLDDPGLWPQPAHRCLLRGGAPESRLPGERRRRSALPPSAGRRGPRRYGGMAGVVLDRRRDRRLCVPLTLRRVEESLDPNRSRQHRLAGHLPRRRDPRPVHPSR